MFTINDDLSIYVTRGDIVHLNVSAVNEGGAYKFKVGDVIRLKIFGKKDCADIIFQKDFPVTTESETVEIFLTGQETRIGGVINKHSDYWYEIELNPESNPQTIIGYDEEGAKVFRLFPEGRDLTENDPVITPEDIPIVDAELDMTSKRPVENRAIAIAVEKAKKELKDKITSEKQNLIELLENPQRIYVADSPDINPTDIFGGEWELFDKGFKPMWNAAPNLGRPCDYTVACYRSGNLVKVIVNVTLTQSVIESTKLLTLNFGEMGLDLNAPVSVGVIEPNVLTNVNTIANGASAGYTTFVNVKVKRNGEVFATPILSERTPMTLSADSTFGFEVIIPAAPEQMLGAYCDKFYWRKIN